MDFWSRMLSTIADTVLPENLDDDTLLLQMDEALQEEKSLWDSQQNFLDPSLGGNFQDNGTRHIVLPKRKQVAYYAVVAKFATTAADGKNYQVEYFNPDVIISVGYRVKSQRTSCDGQLGFDDLA